MSTDNGHQMDAFRAWLLDRPLRDVPAVLISAWKEASLTGPAMCGRVGLSQDSLTARALFNCIGYVAARRYQGRSGLFCDRKRQQQTGLLHKSELKLS